MSGRLAASGVHAVARFTRHTRSSSIERALRAAYPPERTRPGVEAIVDIGDDLVFRASTSSFLEWRIFFFGGYEPDVGALLGRVLHRGRCAVDVGAHSGIHTVRMARLAAPGVVLACEPNPATFERLNANIELNRLPNVRAHRLALSDSAGEGLLRVPDPRSQSNEAAASLGPSSSAGDVLEVPVRTTTLDSLAAVEQLDGVDVIKIDVEGFEAAVLAGASTLLQRDRPTLIFEYSQRFWERAGFDLGTAVEQLRSLGYPEPLSITPRGLLPLEAGLPRYKNLVSLSPHLPPRSLHDIGSTS